MVDGDGDGAKEIVFVDGSAQLRYVEEDGTTIRKISNGGVGSNNGIGAGEPADFEGNGTVRVPFVDGIGYLSLVTVDGTKTVLSEEGSAIAVAKASVAAFDWNGDGTAEIVYIDGGTLHLADDIGSGTADTTEITRDGSPVGAAEEPGAA